MTRCGTQQKQEMRRTHRTKVQEKNMFINQPVAGPLCHVVCLRLAKSGSVQTIWQLAKEKFAYGPIAIELNSDCFADFVKIHQNFMSLLLRLEKSCKRESHTWIRTTSFWTSRVTTGGRAKACHAVWCRPGKVIWGNMMAEYWNTEYAWLQLFVRHIYKNLFWHQFLSCFVRTNLHHPSLRTHTFILKHKKQSQQCKCDQLLPARWQCWKPDSANFRMHKNYSIWLVTLSLCVGW